MRIAATSGYDGQETKAAVMFLMTSLIFAIAGHHLLQSGLRRVGAFAALLISLCAVSTLVRAGAAPLAPYVTVSACGITLAALFRLRSRLELSDLGAAALRSQFRTYGRISGVLLALSPLLVFSTGLHAAYGWKADAILIVVFGIGASDLLLISFPPNSRAGRQ